MSSIYSFLQKRKMHESQHGFVMVFTAYILSFLMLVLGSDVFYNINTSAKGISEDTEEETTDLYSDEAYVVRYTDTASQKLSSSLVNPYGLTEAGTEGADSNGPANRSTSGDTVWLFGNAMDSEEFDSLMEQVNIYASTNGLLKTASATKDNAKENISSFSVDENVDKSESKETKETSSKTVWDVTSEEVKMLERIVEAEATGEDMKGKILIANVIFNRIEAKEFPDTVKEVIFQESNGEYQFSPVDDERYWKVKITKETKEAVQRALEGEDYSKGALYFIAKRRSNSGSAEWFDTHLKWLFKHGGHDFYKNK